MMAVRNQLLNIFSVSKFFQNRFVHSWTPLAAAFNTRTSNTLSLKILKEHKGLFNVPELTTHEGFYLLKENCVLHTDDLINEATSPNRSRKIVEIFDEISDTLCKVADLAEFIRIAHPTATFSKAAEIACITVSGIVEKLNTNAPLYAALKHVVLNGDKLPTNDIDKHVAQLFLFDFEQCGIHLNDTERYQVVELNNAILHLSQHFVAGTANPRVIKKEFIPADIRHMFMLNNDNFVISNLYADSKDPRVREFAYRIFLHPDEHQEHLLMQLLLSRHKLAQICGFKTYSERALKGSLAETPEVVMSFLNLLSDSLEKPANKEYTKMNKIKEKEHTKMSISLNAWDIPYYSHKIKKDVLKMNNREYLPYFSIGTCMEGLNTLMNSLYGINFVNEEVKVGETWAEEVYKLAVTHESEGLLGYIYCDLYERTGKQNQDCHFTIQGGKQLSNGDYQLPIVVLMLNLPIPRWPTPSLLSPSMVDNLFHEMGHAMHSMLARTKYQHVTGTRCSTDFAEVPSVLMEFFANDPRVLATFARHYDTGEPMPERMLSRLCASKHVFAASDMQMQLFYSTLDQIYHGEHPLPGNTTKVLSEIQNRYYGIPYVNDTAWQLRFSHLAGYGAKYYSYLMSRAVASWIWQSYFEENPLSRTRGELYRRECLGYGGGKPPKQLVGDFLQREVTPEKLVDALVHEIDEKSRNLQNIEIV